MSIKKRLAAQVLAAASAITCAMPNVAAASEINLTYAFFAPNGTFPAVQMNHWASELESRTNGKVNVDTFPGGTLLSARDMYNGVTQGIVDIGLGSPSGDPGRFPVSSSMSLPLNMPNATVASLVYQGLVKELQPAEMKGFKVLALFTSEPVHMLTRKPVDGLTSLSKLKLGGSGSIMPSVAALGATPVAMLMPSVTEALPTGVIDGVVTSREVLKDFKLAEYVEHAVEYPLGVITFAAVMTEEKWNSLPEDVQQTIEQLASEMPMWTGRYHDQAVSKSIQWGQEKHHLSVDSLPEQEQLVWQQKLDVVVDDWREEMEKQGVPATRILTLIADLKQKHQNADY